MSEKQDTAIEKYDRESLGLVTALTQGLEIYCDRWCYTYIEQLMQNISVDNFIKLFLKITKTYFFEHDENTYGATFDKREKVVKIYKCGKNHKNILVGCPIDYVVKELESRWNNS